MLLRNVFGNLVAMVEDEFKCSEYYIPITSHRRLTPSNCQLLPKLQHLLLLKLSLNIMSIRGIDSPTALVVMDQELREAPDATFRDRAELSTHCLPTECSVVV